MSAILPINMDDLLHCRGMESKRVEFKASWGRAHDRPAGSPNDLRLCERLSQPQRRLRRHRRRRTGLLRCPALVGSVP